MTNKGVIKLIDFGLFTHISRERRKNIKCSKLYVPLIDLILFEREGKFCKSLEPKVRDMYGLALTALCFLDKEIHDELMKLNRDAVNYNDEKIISEMEKFYNSLREKKNNLYSENPYAKILIDIILEPYHYADNPQHIINLFLKEDIALRQHAIKHFVAYDDPLHAKQISDFVENNLIEPQLWNDLFFCIIGKTSIEKTEFLSQALKASVSSGLEQHSIFTQVSSSSSSSSEQGLQGSFSLNKN